MKKNKIDLHVLLLEINHLLNLHFGAKSQEVIKLIAHKSPHKDQPTAANIEALLSRKLTYFEKCFLDNYRRADKYYVLAQRALITTIASFSGRENTKNG